MRKTHLMVLAVVVAAIVLAVGAVSAYADLASDALAPVTTSDVVTSYWNDPVINLSANDNEGVAYIYHEFDEGIVRMTTVAGGPAAAQLALPTTKDDHMSAGLHKLKFWAQDINGNVEAQHVVTFTVALDKAAPTTTHGAIDGKWYRSAVSIQLMAVDGDGESGVKELSYALDGAAPTIVGGAKADVPVPATDGAHVLAFFATDVAGNAEDAQTLTVNMDTHKPVTTAYAASVVRGRKATLKYKVADALPNAGTAKAVIKIKNRSNRVVRTLPAVSVKVNAALTRTFTCTLAKGVYTFTVYATDAAGNTQSKAGSAKLTVK